MTRGRLRHRAEVVLAISLVLTFTGRANAEGGVLPGGVCSTTADCYGGKACLGGRCCAFTQDQYEATPYYSQNVYTGCTACGGTDMWSDADKLPDGTCLSCNATTTRFDASQDSQVAVGPINSGRSPPSYHAEGACLSACGAGMYTQLWIDETMIDSGGAAYLNVYCNTLMGAGYGCSGVSSPDLTCASGVCGHEFCCEDSSCPSGICETQTGNCLASSSDDGSDPHGAPTLTPTPTPTPVDSSGSGGTGEHSPCGGSAAADPRATGGNVSTVGNFTIHTFTSNGTFTVSDATLTELDVLLVGGGGGGGSAVGGGGGGGPCSTPIERQANPGDVSSFPVVVGGGGGGAIYGGDAASEGGESSFGGMAALGGQPGLDDAEFGDAHGGRSGACEGYGPYVCNGFVVDGDSSSGRRRARRRLLFSHDATENCENVCEGHGYDAGMCIGFTGCQWDSGTQECHSAVGSAPCDSGATGGDSFENCENVCDAYNGNPASCDITIGCEYDHGTEECRSKVGSAPCDSGDNCEVVCQSNSYDEWQCNSVTGCQWDDANLECVSTVGPNPCDSGDAGGDSFENCENVCDAYNGNPASCDITIGCEYDHGTEECRSKVGSAPCDSGDNCEVVCQSNSYDEWQCNSVVTGCQWDETNYKCVSTVGPNPCDGSGSVNSYPNDATFCPSWAKYEICSSIGEEASCNAAAECEYANDNNGPPCRPAYTASEVDISQLPNNYQFDYGVCSGGSADSCTSEGCRWVVDGGGSYCQLTLDAKRQQLATASIPDVIAGYILTQGHVQSECAGRDQTSCDNLSPMCTSSSDGASSYCHSEPAYASWLVIEGCQSAMSSDMSLLTAANANYADL